MKNILFFGFMADELTLHQAFESEENPQVSAIKFQMSLLEGFAVNNVNVRVLSALPISSYPTNPKILIRQKTFQMPNSTATVKLMFCINFPFIKLITRLITSTFLGILEVQKTTKPDAIIVYSLHTPFIIAAICLKILTQAPIGVFIPDLPMNMSGHNNSNFRKTFKLIDNRLLQYLITFFDITYPITKSIAEHWLPKNSRSLVIEGIAPSHSKNPANTNLNKFKTTKSNTKRILYTGSFTHIKNFVYLFSMYKELNAELVLVGGGSERFDLEKIADSDSRITIKEFMLGKALDTEIQSACFLINPRDTQWIGASCSFPSKLFDYMTREKPIISTRMEGIPEEYFDCFIEISDTCLDSFKVSIKKALSTPDHEIYSRIKVGLDLIYSKKKPQEVTRKIISTWKP